MSSKLAAYIDHTLLKPDATDEQIKKLCDEAIQHGFAAVCVNPSRVPRCALLLRDTPVKVCTVIGFPLGASTSETKAFEALQAVQNGAREIDMVLNIGALKDRNYKLMERDIRAVVEAAADEALVKVILETCLLTDDEKVKACIAAKSAGASFVKTSTGFSVSGATREDVRLLRETVGPDMGVKASGGIRTLDAARAMIDAGATRIGASASVAIVSADRLRG